MPLRVTATVRIKTRVRDGQRCWVCRMPGVDWHHRRTRRVVDDHTHCTCNGVTLCGPGNTAGDHGWAHKNPFEARAQGLIISRYETRMPFEVPILNALDEWVLLGCDGEITPTEAPNG